MSATIIIRIEKPTVSEPITVPKTLNGKGPKIRNIGPTKSIASKYSTIAANSTSATTVVRSGLWLDDRRMIRAARP
jgi:hypothetical protein